MKTNVCRSSRLALVEFGESYGFIELVALIFGGSVVVTDALQ